MNQNTIKNFGKTFTSAIIGTSAMTLYSYFRSEVENKNFREPEILNMMIDNLDMRLQPPTLTGWILHYKVGFGFASIYHAIWRKTKGPSIISGALLGAANGLIGIAAWDTALKNHPNPPTVARKEFYQHLFFTHIVFGTFIAIGSQWVGKSAGIN